jgi:hypothetical protein
MTTMTTAVTLTESAKALVDSRLDTIDRMLLGRVPRADRLATLLAGGLALFFVVASM